MTQLKGNLWKEFEYYDNGTQMRDYKYRLDGQLYDIRAMKQPAGKPAYYVMQHGGTSPLYNTPEAAAESIDTAA